MRKVLEGFYYDNITPSEKDVQAGSKLHRTVDTAARCESQLAEGFDEVRLALLTKLVKVQHDIDSITATENFIRGFWLGVRMMIEYMDDNDGDIKKGGA